MIAFRKQPDDEGDFKKSSKDKLAKSLQKLLDIIYNDPEFYPGSYHKNVDISQIVQCIYQVLFNDNNKSIHIILDRNKNESLDMTIDKIE